MNYKFAFFATILISAVVALGAWSVPQQEKPKTPADGHDIHVLAPHQVDGKVMGPYHHYCKAVSSEVIECLMESMAVNIPTSAEMPTAIIRMVRIERMRFPRMDRKATRTFSATNGLIHIPVIF